MVASHPIRVMCRRRHKNARRTGAASHKSDTRILTTKSPVARFAGNYATAMRTSFGSSRFPMASPFTAASGPPASHYNRAGLGFASGLGLTIRNLRFPSSKPRVLKSGSGGARDRYHENWYGRCGPHSVQENLGRSYPKGRIASHALLVSAVRPDRDPDDVTCNTPPAARADPDFLHEEAGVAKSVRKIFIRFR